MRTAQPHRDRSRTLGRGGGPRRRRADVRAGRQPRGPRDERAHVRGSRAGGGPSGRHRGSEVRAREGAPSCDRDSPMRSPATRSGRSSSSPGRTWRWPTCGCPGGDARGRRSSPPQAARGRPSVGVRRAAGATRGDPGGRARGVDDDRRGTEALPTCPRISRSGRSAISSTSLRTVKTQAISIYADSP